jgi:flagellar motor switch protein FliN/FliY
MEEFGSAVEAMADTRPAIAILETVRENTGAQLWWKQAFDVRPGALIWVAAPEETWTALGDVVLEAAGIDSAGAEERKSTYVEVLKQALGAVARALSEKAGHDVSCVDGLEEEAPSDAETCHLSIRLKDRDLPAFTLRFSADLLACLDSQAAPEPEPETEEAPAPSQTVTLPGLEMTERAIGTLGLLLDVELPVSVSFGRTQLRIRDILKLISGSIIELDRSISEPVDVIVNNCVVARGEVVVVEGYYGVRIHEVMSRRERLMESRRFLLPATHKP